MENEVKNSTNTLMHKCEVCGEMIANDAVSCPKCGHKCYSSSEFSTGKCPNCQSLNCKRQLDASFWCLIFVCVVFGLFLTSPLSLIAAICASIVYYIIYYFNGKEENFYIKCKDCGCVWYKRTGKIKEYGKK